MQVEYGGTVLDGLLIQQDIYGRWTAFGDSWPERARYWLPCIDHPGDKATVGWNIIAPSDRSVVTNGTFVKTTILPNLSSRSRALSVWRESKPISTYLMVIAVAPFAEFMPPSSMIARSPIHQAVYVEPEILDFLPGPFKYADDIIDYYSKIIAPFPYEKLAHIQSSTKYGGMENASAIFYADDGFTHRMMGPGVIAHETAHQWFGDAVTEREWSHLWLSEGFATYFEELWTQHMFGDSAFRLEMITIREEIIRAKVVCERPVIDTLETNLVALLNENSYQKGAWVLHMLRSLVGDSTFFSSIRSYCATYQHSTAVTDDLEKQFEKISHRD